MQQERSSVIASEGEFPIERLDLLAPFTDALCCGPDLTALAGGFPELRDVARERPSIS